jgi:hypothetical protein
LRSPVASSRVDHGIFISGPARPSESRPDKKGTGSRNEPPRHRVRGPPSTRTVHNIVATEFTRGVIFLAQ